MVITYIRLDKSKISYFNKIYSIARLHKIKFEIIKIDDYLAQPRYIDFMILDCGDAPLPENILGDIYSRYYMGHINYVVLLAKYASRQIPFNYFKTLEFNSTFEKELSYLIVNHRIINENEDVAPLRKKISNVLLNWGFSTHRIGMIMLIDIAIFLIQNKLKNYKLGEIYEIIKNQYACSGACVESNIRLVIKKAYNSKGISFFKENPSNKAFINYLIMYLDNDVFCA